jgi:hypothetical protein
LNYCIAVDATHTKEERSENLCVRL